VLRAQSCCSGVGGRLPSAQASQYTRQHHLLAGAQSRLPRAISELAPNAWMHQLPRTPSMTLQRQCKLGKLVYLHANAPTEPRKPKNQSSTVLLIAEHRGHLLLIAEHRGHLRIHPERGLSMTPRKQRENILLTYKTRQCTRDFATNSTHQLEARLCKRNETEHSRPLTSRRP
jgi:hypothetical protein